MTPLEALAIAAAGFVAGGVNTIVGSGSLLTFPTLLAFGYPPVTANVSNNVGLVSGNVSGVYGYRAELRGQHRRAATLAIGSLLGAAGGATLLLALPSSVFDDVVPLLILVACALMLVRRRPSAQGAVDHPRAALAGSFLTGIYGGYFGAAQGVIMLSILRLCFHEDMQRLNAVKNVLAGVANCTAALIFVFAAHVAWDVALLLAVGSTLGAQVGAKLGRRLPDGVLRWTVVSVGTTVAVILFVT